mmetsp:Transcript_29162/g.43956  ORF Transcript_29162/g.43956 Transcript_29162/m.43956 type:complete len:249 (-) Transcript_29162:1069-1815(-)
MRVSIMVRVLPSTAFSTFICSILGDDSSSSSRSAIVIASTAVTTAVAASITSLLAIISLLLYFSDLNINFLAIDLDSSHIANKVLCHLLFLELNEAKPSGLASVHVLENDSIVDLTVLAEELLQLFVVQLEIQAADEDLGFGVLEDHIFLRAFNVLLADLSWRLHNNIRVRFLYARVLSKSRAINSLVEGFIASLQHTLVIDHGVRAGGVVELGLLLRVGRFDVVVSRLDVDSLLVDIVALLGILIYF